MGRTVASKMEDVQSLLKLQSWMREDDTRRRRWAHLTEGVENDNLRRQLEVLMDNTMVHAATEENTTGNFAPFTTFAFPLIRRVFPSLIAQDLVTVQPIPQPTGLIFFWDFEYGTTRYGTTQGDRPADLNKFNRLYAGGRVLGEVIGTGDGTATTFTLGFFPVVAGSETLYINGSRITEGSDYNINYTTGQITLTAALPNGAALTGDYHLEPGEGSEEIGEVDFRLTSDSVLAESKKLKASWTIEAQQDLAAYHGLDADSELLTFMGQEITREIDQLIINDLHRTAAAGNVSWSETIPAEFKGSQIEWDATLYHAILDADELIYRKRLRNATWIVAGTGAVTRMEKLSIFRTLDEAKRDVTPRGIQRYGILNNRYTVYKDPYFPDDQLLLGYRGTSFFETGYVYSPYVPFYSTPVFMDPKDFKPRRGVMSRYARKSVIPEYYSTVTITG